MIVRHVRQSMSGASCNDRMTENKKSHNGIIGITGKPTLYAIHNERVLFHHLLFMPFSFSLLCL